MEERKSVKIYKYIAIAAIIAASIALACTAFVDAYIDFGSACVKAWERIKYYFAFLVGSDGETSAPPPTAAPQPPIGRRQYMICQGRILPNGTQNSAKRLP